MALLGDTKITNLTLLDGVTGDLNPTNDNVYNLGTSSLKWKNIYATTLNGFATTAGSAITASQAIHSATANTATTASMATSIYQPAAITTNAAYPIILANSSATTALVGTVNKSANLLFNPSTNSLNIIHKDGSSAEFRTTYGSTVDMWLGVGTGNANHGLYDAKAGKWMIVADSAGNVVVNGNASTATTAGFATTANRATTAGYASTAAEATHAATAGQAITAGYATTAGYASTAYGALYSSTASTAAKLGGTTVGSSVKPIYLNSGTPTATEEMIPLLRTNVDFTATTPSPGAYYLDGAKNPVTDATEYGTVLTLPWRKTSNNNYSSQMMLSSSSGVGKVHLYARRNTSTPALGTWTTFLDDDNYTTYTVTKTGTGATGTWSITATTSQQATHAATANTATTATNAQKVVQTNQTAANDYRILLSGSANDTTEYSGTNKNTNLRFNPSTQMLSVGGSITATGGLTIAGNANLNGSTTIQTLTAGSLVVNGGASFNQIPTAPTPDADSNDTSVATTAFVMNAFTANDAMVFKGVVNANGDLPATHSQGWTYRVATSGTYANKVCEVGDIIICVTDGTAANNDHWAVIQNNVDGAVYRGTNAFTDANIIVADSTAGKVKSSGKTISTATATSSSTDSTVPTTKAVWSTIATLDGNLNSTTPSASKTLTAFSQTDGKVSATFGDISITKSQVSDFSHAHGNITNDGKVGTSADYALYTTTGGSVTAGSLAVTAPTADGTATAFISSVSQNSKGQISASKANLPTATTAAAGIIQIGTGATNAAAGNHTHTASLATDSGTSAITLAHGSKYKLTAGGSSVIFTMPASGNTDASVKQSVSTTDSWRKLLLHYTADGTSTASVTTATNQVYAAVGIAAQPSTGTIRAAVYNVLDKVTLQYNTTTNALDFIFA